MAQKFDGVIEGVRYTAEGMIALVRLYERRGPTFSDRVLWTRGELVERLKAKKKIAIGARIFLEASTFDIKGHLYVGRGRSGEVVSTSKSAGERDLLEGCPLF
jgi:hypothetical protein